MRRESKACIAGDELLLFFYKCFSGGSTMLLRYGDTGKAILQGMPKSKKGVYGYGSISV
jgi:hypothetical protein